MTEMRLHHLTKCHLKRDDLITVPAVSRFINKQKMYVYKCISTIFKVIRVYLLTSHLYSVPWIKNPYKYIELSGEIQHNLNWFKTIIDIQFLTLIV